MKGNKDKGNFLCQVEVILVRVEDDTSQESVCKVYLQMIRKED